MHHFYSDHSYPPPPPPPLQHALQTRNAVYEFPASVPDDVPRVRELYPNTPPPPYQPFPAEYDGWQQTSRAFYLDAVSDHPELQASAESGPERHVMAGMQTEGLPNTSRTPRMEVCSQELAPQHGEFDSAPLIPDRPRTTRYDCPLVAAMSSCSALSDRVASVAARINDVFATIDRVEDNDELADVARKMTLNDPAGRRGVAGASMVDFKKTWMYSNSRLPRHMLPMKLYLPTWAVICTAAQASMDVYRGPRRDERDEFIEADWRNGTKAMVINSRNIDQKNIIVLAIRGSKTWNPIDWAINMRVRPTEPTGFLDDPGNACHGGFLQIAKSMIAPVAARLRALLEQGWTGGGDPPSLILTGHSAGGAVASLLYMHMMATSVATELNHLTGFFKRVHCVTFGTPPVSLLPLQNPPGPRRDRNVFLHFANEGDLVVRADRSYLTTIVRIVAGPAPAPRRGNVLRKHLAARPMVEGGGGGGGRPLVTWEVPPATLSNAGRMILLREKPGCRRRAIEAVQVTDEDLRGVVFGDPEMHQMELYKRRIDELAVAAVTGQGMG